MNISASLAGSASESIELGDRYSVISKIGQGGSAAVFKVQDKQLNKPFAVKVMRPELVSDDQANLRFKQEAEAAARMTHPNLVSVYGSGITDNKAPYLVMDCLDGKTLAQTLQEEEYLYSERAVDILIQCCEALVHMHMKGVVHRDIKPSNIFLTKAENNTDIVKIVDFGIAKLHSCQENTHLTQTGAVFGSPLYMSPEQCRGETIDFRSDIYSLGCVAYEMLTGVSPFAADNPIKTIIKHINGSVTPPGIAGSAYQIPEALQSIIMRCLETESKLRYQTVDELLHQLKSFITGAQLQTTPKNIYPSLYRRLAASILDGIILSTVIIGAGYLVSIGQHLPFHLYFPLAVSLQDSFGTFIFWLGFWSLIFVIAGPALFTAILVLGYTGFCDDCVFSSSPVFAAMSLLLTLAYFIACDSSRLCGTPGKRILGMKVVNLRGEKLSFLQATSRCLSKLFLLPLLSLENSIRIVPKVGEPVFIRCLRYSKDLVSLVKTPPKPPTDDWTKTYVINASTVNNPYMPNLQEQLQEQTSKHKDLNEINEKLKVIKGAVAWNIAFSLFVIFILLSTSISQKAAPASPLWFFWIAYISVWAIPPVIYYRRFNRRKKQLLKDRNNKYG